MHYIAVTYAFHLPSGSKTGGLLATAATRLAPYLTARGWRIEVTDDCGQKGMLFDVVFPYQAHAEQFCTEAITLLHHDGGGMDELLKLAKDIEKR